MVSRLTFKGDKKPKKRKRTADPSSNDANGGGGGGGDDEDTTTTNNTSKQLSKPIDTPAAAADDDAAVENDDSWVSADVPSDIGGPVMLVLPTSPPAALACDAYGKVFALAVENIVDGNPASAEPHDVRQVWVAHKVAGTENYRFKGHHGKLLSCDKYGIFSATSEAVSPLESFIITPAENAPAGTFYIQTTSLSSSSSESLTYLTAKTTSSSSSSSSSTKPNTGSSSSSSSSNTFEVRGDATAPGPSTELRIRMQARFKPRIRAERAERAREKISRRALEAAAGRRLEEDEVRRLKRARREGNYHEMLLDVKVKNKHDKYG